MAEAEAEDISDLPGAELLLQGLKDLEQSEITIPSLLISIGRSRLEAAGLKIPEAKFSVYDFELTLYRLIGRDDSLDAYSYYNSLIKQLISFEKALEQRHSKKKW
ncbi:MAG: hypothetical protein NTV34_16095 [Proteobacteria bacterium]|nr:hypothetical protein [Pseudomonadota bacterium]